MVTARLGAVAATDPKDTLADSSCPCVGFVAAVAGTGLAHLTAGLIRSLANFRWLCLITVLPRGDLLPDRCLANGSQRKG